MRNCGLKKPLAKQVCTPGQPVTLKCSVGKNKPPQVARFCDWSHALNSPVPCKYEDSWVPLHPGVSDQPDMLGSTIVTTTPTNVTITCPSPRTGGVDEPGGAFSIYTGAVFPSDATAAVSCTIVR